MKALSSTTSTERGLDDTLDDTLTRPQRAHDDAPIARMEEDGAPVVPTDILGHERDAELAQHAPRRLDVPLAHVHAARGKQRPEHARPAGDLRDGLPRRSECFHLLEHR